MSAQRSVLHLPAFVLGGTGVCIPLIWLYFHWFLSPPLTSDLVVVELSLVSGAGIGLLSWLGFEIGRLRWLRARRSDGVEPRGAYLRGFASSLLAFLALGALSGVIVTVPAAIGRAMGIERVNGAGGTLLTLLSYILYYGVWAAIPMINGLLTGARAEPSAGRAILGGVALGVCGGVVFVLPLASLILLIHGPIPPCAETEPSTCGFLFFSPVFYAESLGYIAMIIALAAGFASGVAAGAGVLVARLTDHPLAQE